MSDKPNIFKPSKLTHTDVRLVELFSKVGKSLDSLPYTEEFDKIYIEAKHLDGISSERDLLDRLLRLRKSGRLPRLDKPTNEKPDLSPEQLDQVASWLRNQIDTMSVREEIPYTEAFDRLADQFKSLLDRDLSRNTVWRILISLT